MPGMWQPDDAGVGTAVPTPVRVVARATTPVGLVGAATPVRLVGAAATPVGVICL